MRRLQPFLWAAFGALLVLLAPAASAQVGIAYTSFANIFTAGQRINAGLGVNVAPGATGTLSLSDGLFEFGRSFKMGTWQSVPYNSGNFTASGSMTWTVTSGQVTAFTYTVIGKTLWVNLGISTSSVGGTPDKQLFVAVPGGFTVTAQTVVQCRLYDNGTFQPEGIAFSAAADGNIHIRIGQGVSNFSLSTNNTPVSFVIPINIS